MTAPVYTMACKPVGSITPVHERCQGAVTNGETCVCECHARPARPAPKARPATPPTKARRYSR